MKIEHKIETLNKASNDLKKAIKWIETVFHNDDDIETYLWRIEKIIDQMQVTIIKKLEYQLKNGEGNV